MLTFAKIQVVIGTLVTMISVLGGFYFLFQDNDELAKVFFVFSPIAFLFIFVGVVTYYLSVPQSKRRPVEHIHIDDM